MITLKTKKIKMEDSTLLFIAAYVVHLVVIYLIIKASVKEGTKKLLEIMRIQANFKREEMRKAGYSEEELEKIVNDVRRDYY